MQHKEELEKFYAAVDPWGYKTNPDDAARKERILAALGGRSYRRALDIGAGEGWITADLPATVKHGIELSDAAAVRFPTGVTRVPAPAGKYDLIVATGVLYKQYDWRTMLDWIKEACAEKGTILLCHILTWEVSQLAELGEPKFSTNFKYREFIEMLRIYDR